MRPTFPETPLYARTVSPLRSEAIAARDEALARVESNSAPWRAVAYDLLVELARERAELTPEDFWARCADRRLGPPPEPRAVGPVFLKAKRAGVLAELRMERSNNPRHHRDWQMRYRSLVAR